MEINNVVKFNTTAEYEVFKASTAYTVPNVSWIVKENKIMTEAYYYVLNGVCLHKDGSYKLVLPGDFDKHYNDIISSGYTVEGVSVVPASHTPDGTTRIISLVNMSYSTPETGTTNNQFFMNFGGYNENITGLKSYGYIAAINNNTGKEETPNSSVYFPSDIFSHTQSITDEKAYYRSSPGYRNAGPSPFSTGETKNPVYFYENNNVLVDMDGSANTEHIIAMATAQTDWRTASTITNDYNPGYYPAACCCKRYGTSGITAGNWYLPAMGELGYLIARLKTINSILTLIASKGETAATVYGDSTPSSNINGNGKYFYIACNTGYADSQIRVNICYVRAFASVKADFLKL